jgi:hypothetical protein
MFNLRSSCIALFITTTLTGCSVIDPDFKQMSSAYSIIVEKYNNDNVLLNIVRASKSMPLSFLDIPSVIGTGSVTTSAGLSATIQSANPASVTGLFSAAGQNVAVTGASFISPSASLSLNRSFNFTQSSLDNAQFMRGFLTELTPDTIHFFAKRHIPTELLYTMVIESIEAEKPNGEKQIYVNNPMLPKYSEFQELLYGLIDLGLSSETVVNKVNFGPPMEGGELYKTIAPIVNLTKDGFVLETVKINGKDMYQIVKTVSTARICFTQNERSEIVKSLYSESIFCAQPGVVASSGMQKAKQPQEKKTTLIIKVRSTRNVFDFLGQVLNAQLNENDPYMVMLRPTGPYTQGVKVSLPMFKILKDTANIPSTAGIDYHGNSYIIPKNDAGYSNMVLDIVSQLLTLNKIPGSIPASPAVLIK